MQVVITLSGEISIKIWLLTPSKTSTKEKPRSDDVSTVFRTPRRTWHGLLDGALFISHAPLESSAILTFLRAVPKVYLTKLHPTRIIPPCAFSFIGRTGMSSWGLAAPTFLSTFHKAPPRVNPPMWHGVRIRTYTVLWRARPRIKCARWR